jgi:hypothetical protein
MEKGPDTILAEWRAVERALETASDDEREDLEARAAALRNEYQAAVEVRERRLDVVSQS